MAENRKTISNREQEDHIQQRTGRPYPTLHYHHHNKSAFRHALRERERERCSLLAADHLVAVVLGGQNAQTGLDNAATQTQHQMQGGLCNTQSHILQGSDWGAHTHCAQQPETKEWRKRMILPQLGLKPLDYGSYLLHRNPKPVDQGLTRWTEATRP